MYILPEKFYFFNIYVPRRSGEHAHRHFAVFVTKTQVISLAHLTRKAPRRHKIRPDGQKKKRTVTAVLLSCFVNNSLLFRRS